MLFLFELMDEALCGFWCIFAFLGFEEMVGICRKRVKYGLLINQDVWILCWPTLKVIVGNLLLQKKGERGYSISQNG